MIGIRRVVLERDYWISAAVDLTRPKLNITPYIPKKRQAPARMLPVESAWKGIESILADLIERFHIATDRCLEFGVEYGYSTAAFAAFFDSVIGVDPFLGDKHTTNHSDIYEITSKRLAEFPNIRLERSSYQEWCKKDHSSYDLIHVDIVHTYADTFACGLWSAKHSGCTIFHDTRSFPAVRRAVKDIARHMGRSFYDFEESNGLGIVV